MASPSPLSPIPGLRHRGLTRATTIAEAPLGTPATARRNSILSDSVSEARNTIRSSTDELLFPRAGRARDDDFRDEESHWQSAPLGLALLPAVAGIFFQNGSAFVTDVTLLALAAVFLNWSVRLPWEWYRSARTIRYQNGLYGLETPIDLDTLREDTREGETAPSPSPDRDQDKEQEQEQYQDQKKGHTRRTEHTSAATELQVHELAALASCFIFPLIGTWILHTIRSNLSRPSEGLVSNYNLTIFLLAAEIRPFSHLLKMVQTRTLHLQRIIASSDDDDDNRDRIDPRTILDLSKRLEELEAHVAETAAARIKSSFNTDTDEREKDKETRDLAPQESTKTLLSHLETESTARKSMQSDIAALNRAMRRYEKRTAVTAYTTQTRLQVLESKTRDALSLAADAQRANARQRGIFAFLLDWIAMVVLVPLNVGVGLATLPVVVAGRGVRVCKDVVFGRGAVSSSREKKSSRGDGASVDASASASASKGKAPQRSTRPVTSQQQQQQQQQRRAKRATIIEE
ncbi:uncharacterized protein BDV17DRAFT_287501 [Aspergillus undulatus]|uniref:uncharacterized protein n=1 Tax=Aspergillus undulatus TaxID=1810928 RepID=UPI003CCCD69F